jgi:uncharacterized membrane protein
MEALKSAADTTKQLVSLSTGVLTVTITFVDKLGLGADAKTWLGVAWAAFLVSIAGGVFTLLAITTLMELVERGAGMDPPRIVPADPFHPTVRPWAVTMVVAFGIGMTGVAMAGAITTQNTFGNPWVVRVVVSLIVLFIALIAGQTIAEKLADKQAGDHAAPPPAAREPARLTDVVFVSLAGLLLLILGRWRSRRP